MVGSPGLAAERTGLTWGCWGAAPAAIRPCPSKREVSRLPAGRRALGLVTASDAFACRCQARAFPG